VVRAGVASVIRANGGSFNRALVVSVIRPTMRAHHLDRRAHSALLDHMAARHISALVAAGMYGTST
jgi:hypothetical protein